MGYQGQSPPEFPPMAAPRPLLRRVAAAGAVLAGFLLLAPPAHAGGVGFVATGGFHADRVYSYDCDEATGACDQNPPETQVNGNPGAGLELVLGDKDNKVLAVFRGYWLADAPQHEPEGGDSTPWRDTWRHIGVINGGLQFGVLGDPANAQLNVVANIGSGFLTNDFTEFIFGEAGVGGSYMVARRVQLAASVTGGARYRKRFYPATSAYLGVRYLFD